MTGYRFLRIVVPLSAWLVAAASSPTGQQGGSKEANTDQEIAQALNSIASSLKETVKPGRETAECAQGSDDRESDLCAQWKAADAAETSAYWTRAGFFLAIVGTAIGVITVVCAFLAARYAAQTVRAARDTLDESKRSTLLQLRPYMVVVHTKVEEIDRELPCRMWRVEFCFKNDGQTPARIVEVEVGRDVLEKTDGLPVVLKFPGEGHVFDPETVVGAGGFYKHDNTTIVEAAITGFDERTGALLTESEPKQVVAGCRITYVPVIGGCEEPYVTQTGLWVPIHRNHTDLSRLELQVLEYRSLAKVT